MNQKEFAEFLRIPASTLSRYMTGGKPRFDELVQMSEALDISLLGEDNATYESRASPSTLADLKACLTGLGLSEEDIDFLLDFVAVRTDKRRKGQGRAATE